MGRIDGAPNSPLIPGVPSIDGDTPVSRQSDVNKMQALG